jgi:hypothetical protein
MPTYAMPPSAAAVGTSTRPAATSTAHNGISSTTLIAAMSVSRSSPRSSAGPPPQAHRVAGPRHRRGEDPDVAGVQLERAQHVEAAAAHDDEHAAEGDEAAGDRERAQALPEQQRRTAAQ